MINYALATTKITIVFNRHQERSLTKITHRTKSPLQLRTSRPNFLAILIQLKIQKYFHLQTKIHRCTHSYLY